MKPYVKPDTPKLERSKKMGRKNSSLMIFGFLFLMILQFFPKCLAARNLEDFPPPFGDQNHNNNQSKSPVEGSAPKQAPSANNDHAPTNGVVQMPPQSFHRRSSSTQRNGSQTVTRTDNGVTNNSTKTWSEKQNDTNWNGHPVVEKSSSVNFTNNGNGGGQVVNNPPPIAYAPPNGLEYPRFQFPPPVPPFTSP